MANKEAIQMPALKEKDKFLSEFSYNFLSLDPSGTFLLNFLSLTANNK